MNFRLLPPDEMLQARVTMPPSKSISNRALILEALTENPGTVSNIAACDDTEVLAAALAQGPSAREVNVGAAGTSMRFLTAYYAAMEGADVTLDGSERMRKRPIAPLVDALRALGADIDYAAEEGFPPLRIRGKHLRGGEVELEAGISSQYISALLMVAPLMQQGLTLRLRGEIASRPYIIMTLSMMAARGVEADFEGNVITVEPQAYRAADTVVEGDWSAAAFWLEIAAVCCGCVTLDGVTLDSIQGDRVAVRLFAQLGVDTVPGEEGGLDLMPSPDQDARFTADMASCPDLAQAIIVTCTLVGIPFRITGLHSLRIKETDRLEALRRELAKIGVPVEIEGDNVMEWTGRRLPITQMPVFDTYADHRMAMAFAPVALCIPGIIINDIEVVSKSYPDFWDHLRSAGFTLLDASEPWEPETAE